MDLNRLQQILNRAYYALHDMLTPLIWAIINLALNVIVEIPLLWTDLHESAMAVGTLVSFVVQTIAMLYLLDRRVGGLELRRSARAIFIMIIATSVMGIACLITERVPGFPHGTGKISSAK